MDTTAGQVQPGAVVFATGLPPALDGLDLEVPWERVKGHLLVTEPTTFRLPGIVAPVATQLEDGRLLVGGTFDMGDESPVVRQEIIDSILAGLYATLPQLQGLRADYTWCCFPAPASRRAPGHRPDPWSRQRLADFRALPHRDPARPGDGPGAGQLDRLGSAARRGDGLEQRAVRGPRPHRPLTGARARGAPVRGAPVRGAPVRGAPVRGAPVRGCAGQGVRQVSLSPRSLSPAAPNR